MKGHGKRTAVTAAVMGLAAALAFGGCAKKDGNTVSLGAIFPLSGQVAYYGTESRDGILLAVDEINAGGGLLGKQIALVVEDDEGNGEKSVNAFTKLTTKNQITIILGSSTSGATKAMTALAQRNKVLLISPSATDTTVTAGGDFIFRACFIDPFQGTVGAAFAYDTLAVRRAAILYDGGADYNTGLAEAFRRQFQTLGGQIVADEAYQSNEVDFAALATRIRAAGPDVVYLPNYYNDVSLQASQLRAQGITCPFVGGDGWDGLVDIASGNEALNGFWSAGFAADTTDPRGVAFVGAFQAKFNRKASQFAALGYDSMMLVADAIRAAGTFDASVVKDALARISGSYVTGNIRFDANRNPVKSASILEIVREDGKLVNVYKTTVHPR
ncbi:MAG: ABC transporter substrate-binding protein [Spirochaetaceae bacterium]|jgi:branched-chain amino acid transport system substrate-binding protein|nr:ABC transporter substrate-binding protein [Spirochaetaceae bacterium]